MDVNSKLLQLHENAAVCDWCCYVQFTIEVPAALLFFQADFHDSCRVMCLKQTGIRTR